MGEKCWEDSTVLGIDIKGSGGKCYPESIWGGGCWYGMAGKWDPLGAGFHKASGQGDAAAVPQDAGQGLGAPPKAWQGQAGGLLRASSGYLFLDLACRVQSILELVT